MDNEQIRKLINDVGMKIFDEKLNLEVLELISSSNRAEDWVIKKAQELLKLER